MFWRRVASFLSSKEKIVDFHFSTREEKLSNYDYECIERWLELPKEVRRKCLDLLDQHVSKEILDHWLDQYQRGIRIGSDDAVFHFGIGMSIRNLFREVLMDDGLPLVRYEDGGLYRNWDDFYYGGIAEFLSKKIGSHTA